MNGYIATHVFNAASGILFIAGIIFFIMFASSNLGYISMNNNGNDGGGQKGYTPPNPPPPQSLTIEAINKSLAKYQDFYNHYRPHDSIGLETPISYYHKLMQMA